MKQIIRIFTILPALLFLFSCGEEPIVVEKQLRPVKYQSVDFLGGEKIRTFSGKAQTDKIINLSFRSAGILSVLNIKLGQGVKKGQLLAKLDNVQARLSYEQAITQLNSASSQMNTAKLSFNRIRSLYEKGSSSLSDFESAKNAYQTAVESYKSAKRGVELQEEQINYGYLYAPANGVIAALNTELDENITTGQNIAVLNAGTDMEIALGLPESIINGIEEDMLVDVDFSAVPGKMFKGKVTEVAPAVDQNTATYPIKIILTNPSADIKSGMAASVTFDLGHADLSEPKIVVPTHTVGEDSKGRFVFLIKEEGTTAKIVKTYVTIGELTAQGFEITSGLSKGQKIAIAGMQTLLDGQEVKL